MRDDGWGRVGVGVPKGSFRPSGVFLGCLAVCVVGGVMAWNDFGNPGFDVFLFVLFGWIVSLSLHEYSHALFAFRGGDRTVASRGYLKLNPLKYAHPVLSIVLPVAFLLLGGIGLPGGAVWVDHSALRNRNVRSLVSLVGPAMNLLLAVLLSLPFILDVATVEHLAFWEGVAFLAALQLMAALLNILPIPGLDGGNAIRPWLNVQWGRWYDQFAAVGMLLLFALLYLPVLNQAFFGTVDVVGDALGVPMHLYPFGYSLFRFWDQV